MNRSQSETEEKYLVYLCRQPMMGGFADRLKGVVSSYCLSVITGRRFIVHWTYPCDITYGLLPNGIDWLPPGDVRYGSQRHLYLIDPENYETIRPFIVNGDIGEALKEDVVSVNTNMDFLGDILGNGRYADFFAAESADLLFRESFHRLFRPIGEIEDIVRTFRDDPAPAIGIHARFGGLKNDFDYVFDRGFDAASLKDRICGLAGRMGIDIGACRLFVCSDYEGFGEIMEDFFPNQCLTTPGPPLHIDRQNLSPEENIAGFLKCVLDFCLLGACRMIFRTYGEFASRAGMVSGVPVHNLV